MTKKKSLEMGALPPIATNLQILMTQHETTEVMLARAINTSVMTIRRILSGHTPDPRISTMDLIAQYFNVSIDSFLRTQGRIPLHLENRCLPQYVPVLTWDILKQVDIISEMDLSTWTEWHPVMPDYHTFLGESFALKSRPSMLPWCPVGSLLLIGPCPSPKDGDLVLIRMKESREMSIRRLLIDVPNWILQPMIEGAPIMIFDEAKTEILGFVVLTICRTRELNDL